MQELPSTSTLFPVFADVAFPSSPRAFTYAAPFPVHAGDSVRCPFRTIERTGVVTRLHTETPVHPVKPLLALAVPHVLTPAHLTLVTFLHSYYGASLGKAVSLCLPFPTPLTIHPCAFSRIVTYTPPTPTPDQQTALAALTTKSPLLLHGITGSGKTEVYIQALIAAVKAGAQSIFLVPEISLIPQIASTLTRIFGAERIAIWHSALSQSLRRTTYQRIASGSVSIVIGTRSALFAPLFHLGCIILDEEHEWTYKSEHDPKYHARTAAQILAQATSAQLILGSATPSFETYAAAENGKIRRVLLSSRAGGASLPTVRLVDLRHETWAHPKALISDTLFDAITDRLRKKEQVILLHNRRGYSSSLICDSCGWRTTCPSCTAGQTYHKKDSRLICHSCGRIDPVPTQCPSCNSPHITDRGIGTEKLEVALTELFPSTRITRLDRDTTAPQNSHATLLTDFQNGDILLGTQMVAKGLDFPRVTLSAIMLAESSLLIPDFRASEKAYALFSQLAGRSGRGATPGEVLIQTFDPTLPLLTAVKNHDYHGFFTAENALRVQFGYPPTSRLARIEITGKTEAEAEAAAAALLPTLPPAQRALIVPPLHARRRNSAFTTILLFGADPKALALFPLPRTAKLDIDPVHAI